MTASIRGTSSGGWLRSASMTPTISASAASKPSTTAVPSPSLPARCTTRIGKLRASSSATAPVPSGELSSTMTSSPSMPPRVVRGEDRAHQLGQAVAFVVGGDHERERGGGGDARWQGKGSRSTIIQAVRLAYFPRCPHACCWRSSPRLFIVRLPSLVQPMGPDQGLYAYVGERILHGELAYRDAWDQKPPGDPLHLRRSARALARATLVVPAADLAAAALVAALLWTSARGSPDRSRAACPRCSSCCCRIPALARYGGVRVRAQGETFIALAVSAALAALVVGARVRSGAKGAGARGALVRRGCCCRCGVLASSTTPGSMRSSCWQRWRLSDS